VERIIYGVIMIVGAFATIGCWFLPFSDVTPLQFVKYYVAFVGIIAFCCFALWRLRKYRERQLKNILTNYW